ncbi:MAG: penicillin acylase family protein [Deltaproteobacteria bacterium]|nr:penicillin acylase family protein [Deltaproteobacteria bacterium]
MKRWILIIAIGLVCITVMAAGGGYLWIQHSLKRSLPQISGEIVLPGIREDVKIIRDTFGVPHIHAKNETDLYLALGYAMAQDRLWEMEFSRRLGQGRLAEIFGEKFVRVDRYFRMLTATGINSKVLDRFSPALRSFADGVNAYIKIHKDRLPAEFRLLRFEPEPWQPDDYVQIVKIIAWSLSSGWKIDLLAAEILKKAGEKRFKDAFPLWPDQAPLIIPRGFKSLSLNSDAVFETLSLMEDLIGLHSMGASNNWVVAGKKSVTGKPILANDTHLPLKNPSFWWEVHLICPGVDVTGFAVPGIPGIPIGQNPHVAWGITNTMVDDVDFYVEKINPDNPRQYWYRDHWEDMEVKVETIAVKGKDPVRAEILLTRNGPVVTDPKKDPGKGVISARWAFTQGLQPVQAGNLLLRARDVKGVTDALRYWEVPSQNFVFADTGGNIGVWCCATVPIRKKGDGLLPVPGWTGEYEWEGYVPFEKRPHLINPERGFVATANNKVTGRGYPYLISRYWEPTDRITRIVELLEAKERLSVADFKQMQQDTYCPQASDLTPMMIRVLEERFQDQDGKKAREILSGWDFVMDKGSAAACVYEMTYRKIIGNIFRDEMGDQIFKRYLKTSLFPPRAVSHMVRKGSSPWFDNIDTTEKETLDDIIALSLKQTLSELKERLGDDPDQWSWDRIHTLTFEHVLGKKKPLNLIFNLGPFPVGGNLLTVNKRKYALDNPYNAIHGVSMRMIVDFSDMAASLHVLPTGQSGQLKSPNYRDQIPLYLSGRYHPVWIGAGEAEKQSRGILTLKPM